MRGYAVWTAVFGLIATSAMAKQAPEQPTSPTAKTAVALAPTSPTVALDVATSPITATDRVAEKWLTAMEERHRDHRRAKGEFTQTKTDPVFLEEIKATGKFYYERPNNFRCDYDKPDPSTNLVVGDRVTLYFPDFKQAERYRVGREGSGIGEVNQMLLGFGIDAAKVAEHFLVANDRSTSADIVRLIFVPKAKREERPFARFILELTKRDLTPTMFRIIGEESDETVIKVTQITWNAELPPDIFDLKLPRDVEIIEEQ